MPQPVPVRKQFRPNPWLSLLALGAFVGLLALGMWQAGRYNEKTANVAYYKKQHDQLPPVTGLQDLGADRKAGLLALQFRRAVLQGTLETDQVHLLTARYVLGQLGYGVVFPLKLASPGSHPRVLVHLGWIPEAKVAEYLAQLRAAPPTRFEGRLQIASVRDEAAQPIREHLGRPVWRNADPTALARVLPGLEPELMLQAGKQASGEVVDPKKFPVDGYVHPVRLAPAKHVEYAATWFGLAGTLVAVWFVLGWREVAGPPSVTATPAVATGKG